jgi:hypothetical protein
MKEIKLFGGLHTNEDLHAWAVKAWIMDGKWAPFRTSEAIVAMPNLVIDKRCCECSEEWCAPFRPQNLMVHEVLGGRRGHTTHPFGDGGEPDGMHGPPPERKGLYPGACPTCGWGPDVQSAKKPHPGYPAHFFWRLRLANRRATMSPAAKGNSCLWTKEWSFEWVHADLLPEDVLSKIFGPLSRLDPDGVSITRYREWQVKAKASNDGGE